MKRLGNLLLPSTIQWTDQYSWSPVAQETERTLGGLQVVWSTPLVGGRPITLEAARGITWLTKTMVDQIAAMAAEVGVSYLDELSTDHLAGGTAKSRMDVAFQ